MIFQSTEIFLPHKKSMKEGVLSLQSVFSLNAPTKGWDSRRNNDRISFEISEKMFIEVEVACFTLKSKAFLNSNEFPLWRNLKIHIVIELKYTHVIKFTRHKIQGITS